MPTIRERLAPTSKNSLNCIRPPTMSRASICSICSWIGVVVVDDVAWCRGKRLAHQTSEGVDEVPQLNLLDDLVGQVSLAHRAVVGQTRVALLPRASALFKHRGGVLELFVFQQLPHQLAARVFFVASLLAGMGQQHARP